MNSSQTTARKRFAIFAWCVLLYNIPVILWGAYVRVSFSGDGCGANWPTCGGQYLPAQMTTPRIIEFTHRMMTSLDTVAVLAMLLWAFRAFPKGHAVRRYTAASLVFLLVEALLGAGLVLFRYVARDQSVGRVWYLSAHLTNTMLLLAALAATAWLASTGTTRIRLASTPGRLVAALGVVVFVSVTGTVTALGDTLFPASSLAAGMQSDFASTSSLLLRLRVIHPLIALTGAVYLVWISSAILRSGAAGTRIARASTLVIAITILQLVVGMLNLALLAPIPMQLVHLLMADLVWISIVVLALEALVADASISTAHEALLRA